MEGHICPWTKNECPNGTVLDDSALSASLRIAYEDDLVSIATLAKVIKRHKCTVRAAIISAGGTIRPGGTIPRYLRGPS
jgi:hypothetical protein